jgi:hypothetical protein
MPCFVYYVDNLFCNQENYPQLHINKNDLFGEYSIANIILNINHRQIF